MIRHIRTWTVCTVCAAMTALPFSAQALDALDSGTYVQSIQPERYSLTAEEAASGDAVIPASIYIKGGIDSKMNVYSAECRVVPDDSGMLYFRNIFSPNSIGEMQTYSYLGGTFSSSYRPFCFGKVTDGRYSVNTALLETHDFCIEPIEGAAIYYEGNDTISFTLPGKRYVDENGVLAPDDKSHVITCPLTINDDGSASYTYPYANSYLTPGQTKPTIEAATATGIIPYYQPEMLEKGDRIPGKNDLLSWLTMSSSVGFLGNSDDFPLTGMDVRFKKDTPCGIYDLSFNENYCAITVSADGKFQVLPMRYEGASVIVGAESAVGNSITVPDYACYYAENNKTITAHSMGASMTCDVTFTDGTVQTLDVTGAVNADVSPQTLFAEAAASDEFSYIGTVKMLCGDTEIALSPSDDTAYAQMLLIGKKGDVNMDGVVNVSDATDTLTYFAKSGAGLDASFTEGSEAEEILAYFLADIDTQSQTKEEGGTIDVSDASAILSYFSAQGAGLVLSWDNFI